MLSFNLRWKPTPLLRKVEHSAMSDSLQAQDSAEENLGIISNNI